MASRARKQTPPRPKSRDFLAVLVLAFAAALPIACRSDGPDPTVAANLTGSAALSAQADFSGQRAWKQMRALNEIGARVSGTDGSIRGRAYLEKTLKELNVHTVVTTSQVTNTGGDAVELAHLTAEFPGRSRDVLLLAAHYDTTPGQTDPPRRNDQNASGPALLLELARALRARPTPEYTIWLTFIDGDAFDVQGEANARNVNANLGTQSLIDEWSRNEDLVRVRAAVFFGNVGERDHPILRDIDSPRIYREIFWEVAYDLGFETTFPSDSQYGVTNTGRATLAQAQMRSAVALQNAPEPLAQAPSASDGADADSKPLRPSAGFEAVGKVTLEVLVRTAAKLRKIDRFAEAPLKAGREEPALPTRSQ